MKKITLALNVVNGLGLAADIATAAVEKNTSTPPVTALLTAIASAVVLQAALSIFIMNDAAIYKKNRNIVNTLFLIGEIGTIASVCSFVVWNLTSSHENDDKEKLKILSACFVTVTLVLDVISLAVLYYKNRKSEISGRFNRINDDPLLADGDIYYSPYNLDHDNYYIARENRPL